MSMAVANRYARALADVLAEKGDYRHAQQELADFAAVYHESLQLREVYKTPAVSVDKKLKILTAITAQLGTSHVIKNFLRVLLMHYRMNLLPQIGEAFRRISNELLGVVQVRITSAATLSEPERQALGARFSEITGKQLEMEYSVDRELIGGVRAQIESTVYDGSVRGQLEHMRQQFEAQ
jgi:F-type H+-transporting ATPase subunit delta